MLGTMIKPFIKSAFSFLAAGCVLFSVFFLYPGQSSASDAKDPGNPGPTRIIALAPSATEILFALGCGDRVVGIADFCTYPPEALTLPKVGGFYNPNLERLTALSPDLVIVQGKHERVARFCKRRGTPVFHVNITRLWAVFGEVQRLGKALESEDQAKKLVEDIRGQLKKLKARVSAFPRKKVFICIGRGQGGLDSLYTAGGQSYVSDIIAAAGGTNIYADVMMPYPEASKESLLRRAPDVIIEMRPNETMTPEKIKKAKKDWDVLEGIPAVENKNIHIFTDDMLLIPGPRMGQAADTLARTICPEAFE